ncbi:MAG: hypothetical protein F4Z08_05040 [Chloroflexi bacterium]|nr:hypothetical protein [Chloroflexota bacterium]
MLGRGCRGRGHRRPVAREDVVVSAQPPDVRREGVGELGSIPERLTAAACFGDAQTVGDHVVIPVAEVVYGVGFGYGDDRDSTADADGRSGGGGGGGGRARAVAVIHASPDGVRVHPIRDETAITLAAIGAATATTIIVARMVRKLIRG